MKLTDIECKLIEAKIALWRALEANDKQSIAYCERAVKTFERAWGKNPWWNEHHP